MEQYSGQNPERYSEEAQRLLTKWNCMSRNMQSALTRFHQLEREAAAGGPEKRLKLNRIYQAQGLDALYWEIGRRLRGFSGSEGVERLMSEDDESAASGGIARFVDFKISEEALPELDSCVDEMNELIITLTAKLCLIRL